MTQPQGHALQPPGPRVGLFATCLGGTLQLSVGCHVNVPWAQARCGWLPFHSGSTRNTDGISVTTSAPGDSRTFRRGAWMAQTQLRPARRAVKAVSTPERVCTHDPGLRFVPKPSAYKPPSTTPCRA